MGLEFLILTLIQRVSPERDSPGSASTQSAQHRWQWTVLVNFPRAHERQFVVSRSLSLRIDDAQEPLGVARDGSTSVWMAHGLERKLAEFQRYYNLELVHASLGGETPDEFGEGAPCKRANLSNFTWKTHCGGLVELPIAA